MATFINCNIFINKACYMNNIIELLKVFNEQYKLPLEYLAIWCELIEELDEKIVRKSSKRIPSCRVG